MIKYITGDLFEIIKPLSHQKLVIPHVCNIHRVAGAGFVIPLQKHFPFSLIEYKSKDTDWNLGNLNLYKQGNVTIANMIAQTLNEPRPLYYNSLCSCMDKVALLCILEKSKIIAPKFGSGLSRGDWLFIEELIYDCWIRKGIDVTIINWGKNS